MFKAKKSLSQNFLIDKNIRDKIINLTKLKNKIVMEIGPGYGFMTDKIIQNKPKKIYLIEKDFKLSNFLKEKYISYKNVIIINEDILNYNFNSTNNLIIISNLPYNVSTKIILHLFGFKDNIDEMIFMLQREVARKFNYNLPKMNKYKFLTKLVSNFTIHFDVSAKVFIPKPKVKSSVVKFKLNEKKIDWEKAIIFSNLIFKNIRKKINNNIEIKEDSEMLHKRVDQLTIKEILYIYNFFQF